MGDDNNRLERQNVLTWVQRHIRVHGVRRSPARDGVVRPALDFARQAWKKKQASGEQKQRRSMDKNTFLKLDDDTVFKYLRL